MGILFGIGAYCSTILLMRYQLSPWIGMIAAMALAGAASIVIGWPSFRLRGYHFALGTIAPLNWSDYYQGFISPPCCGGAAGISDLGCRRRLVVHAIPGQSGVLSDYLRHVSARAHCRAARSTRSARIPVAALRSSHEAAEVVGVDTTRTKLVANFISCALIGAYGVVYAQFTSSSTLTRCSASGEYRSKSR